MLLGSARDVFKELNNIIGAEVDSAAVLSNASTCVAAAKVEQRPLSELQQLPTCLTLVVPREAEDAENRCAITPQSAIKLRDMVRSLRHHFGGFFMGFFSFGGIFPTSFGRFFSSAVSLRARSRGLHHAARHSMVIGALSACDVPKLGLQGFDVLAEAGVGERANISNAALERAAVTIVPAFADLYARADVCIKVNPPAARNGTAELAMVPEGSVRISSTLFTPNPQSLPRSVLATPWHCFLGNCKCSLPTTARRPRSAPVGSLARASLRSPSQTFISFVGALDRMETEVRQLRHYFGTNSGISSALCHPARAVWHVRPGAHTMLVGCWEADGCLSSGVVKSDPCMSSLTHSHSLTLTHSLTNTHSLTY